MDTETVKEKAEIFLKYDKRIFLRTIYNDYHFCDILLVGEDFLYIQDFKGKRAGQKFDILWMDIAELTEYREEDQNV